MLDASVMEPVAGGRELNPASGLQQSGAVPPYHMLQRSSRLVEALSTTCRFIRYTWPDTSGRLHSATPARDSIVSKTGPDGGPKASSTWD